MEGDAKLVYVVGFVIAGAEEIYEAMRAVWIGIVKFAP
jgi:hypothetical protein